MSVSPDRLVADAADAFAAEWSERSFSDAALLTAIADGLEGDSDPIVATAVDESGLGEVRMQGEMVRTTRQLRAFAEIIERGEHLDAIIDTADAGATPPRPDQRRMAVAIGPVAVFEAGNFPLAFGVPGGDTASALGAGCPVIAKSHPGHPETSARVAAVIAAAVERVGAPSAWFSMVDGGVEAGQALAGAAELEAIAFTGSFQGGQALYRAGAARERPIPVFSEMGSINPVFVTAAAAAADGEAIAAALAGAVGASLGQLCTKPGLICVVDDAAGRALVESLRATLAETEAGRMLDSGIQRRFRESLAAALEDPRTTTLLHPREEPEVEAASLLELRAAGLAADDARLEEVFGPAAIIAWVDDDAALGAAARAWRLGSLTATLYATASDAGAAAIIRAVSRHAGRVVLGAPPTGVTVGRATVHGGPWPATSMSSATSVGMTAIRRFLRPVGLQGMRDELLPRELQDANPLGIVRLVDGELTRDAVVRR